MEIHIDTKRDSKDELRKLAQFLLSLGDASNIRINKAVSRNIFDDPSPSLTPTTTESAPEATNAFAGMFGDSSSTSTSTTTSSETPTISSLLSDTKDKLNNLEKEGEEAPRIIPY